MTDWIWQRSLMVVAYVITTKDLKLAVINIKTMTFWNVTSYNVIVCWPRKEGQTVCLSHNFAVTHGEELLYLQIVLVSGLYKPLLSVSLAFFVCKYITHTLMLLKLWDKCMAMEMSTATKQSRGTIDYSHIVLIIAIWPGDRIRWPEHSTVEHGSCDESV